METKETTMHLSEYLKKFKTAIEIAEKNHESLKKLYEEVDRWIFDVNSIVRQFKSIDLGFCVGICANYMYVAAEFGHHPQIRIFCFKNGVYYGVTIEDYQKLDLTKEELKHEVLSNMLRMMNETLLVNLEWNEIQSLENNES